ncbi:hypothetical protein OPV22_002330 [Ensete ventricosum]|uniref:Uncharacterized protein n=1 Tax=Ensete ventricosum TaxID=4639 RepID=A0AAV8RXQ2_ENSVE|nr:hypothetical protein OPV22_002330 [Ensete ventricosum]
MEMVEVAVAAVAGEKAEVQAPAPVMERVLVPVMEGVLVPETLEVMARVAAAVAVEAADKVMVQALDMGLALAQALAQATYGLYGLYAKDMNYRAETRRELVRLSDSISVHASLQ